MIKNSLVAIVVVSALLAGTPATHAQTSGQPLTPSAPVPVKADVPAFPANYHASTTPPPGWTLRSHTEQRGPSHPCTLVDQGGKPYQSSCYGVAELYTYVPAQSSSPSGTAADAAGTVNYATQCPQYTYYDGLHWEWIWFVDDCVREAADGTSAWAISANPYCEIAFLYTNAWSCVNYPNPVWGKDYGQDWRSDLTAHEDWANMLVHYSQQLFGIGPAMTCTTYLRAYMQPWFNYWDWSYMVGC